MTGLEMRAYLLGQSTEDEAVRFESELLDNEEVLAALHEAEDDLFDEFATGGLSSADRRRFVARYEQEQARIVVARAFAARAARARGALGVSTSSKPGRTPYWIPLAAAATVAASITGGLWSAGRTRSITPSQTAAAPAAIARAPVTSAIWAVTLATSRSTSRTPEVAVPPDAPLEIRVRLDPADRFARYSLELHSASGESVWRADVREAAGSSDPTLVGTVPADAVRAGSYELAVRGFTSAGAAEDLGFATVSIRR